MHAISSRPSEWRLITLTLYSSNSRPLYFYSLGELFFRKWRDRKIKRRHVLKKVDMFKVCWHIWYLTYLTPMICWNENYRQLIDRIENITSCCWIFYNSLAVFMLWCKFSTAILIRNRLVISIVVNIFEFLISDLQYKDSHFVKVRLVFFLPQELWNLFGEFLCWEKGLLWSFCMKNLFGLL